MSNATGRITAGIPGLLPDKRGAVEVREKTRERDRTNLQKKIANDLYSVAPDGAIETTSLEVQLGHPMSSSDLILRLGKMNRGFIFEVSKADSSKQGIYIMTWIPNETGSEYVKRFVCGFENGFMPEFSVRHFKDILVPDPSLEGGWQKVRTFVKETRGWRTVLARLIRERLITESDVSKYFTFSRDSKNWKGLTT